MLNEKHTPPATGAPSRGAPVARSMPASMTATRVSSAVSHSGEDNFISPQDNFFSAIETLNGKKKNTPDRLRELSKSEGEKRAAIFLGFFFLVTQLHCVCGEPFASSASWAVSRKSLQDVKGEKSGLCIQRRE
jgi:hypothetical protein